MTTPTTIRVQVLAKRAEAEAIVSFELASADGTPLPPFSAGAHIDVQVGPGLIRQYSLCNDPSERHRYLIAVLRDPHSRGGSRAMHDSIQVGDIVQISAPKNHFPLSPASHYLLLAGGVGITPILSMAEQLARNNAGFFVHYCTRSSARTAFKARILASPFAGHVRFHHDEDPDGEPFDIDTALRAAPPGTHVYVCGPAGFIDFVTGATKAHGWGNDRVHLEYFGAAPQQADADRAFDVKIASTGQVIGVPPGRTVIQVLEAHGIAIPTSCEQGVCGTCITRVLDGTPDHRDHYLTDEEQAANDQFTPCCSRARTASLLLDL
jgi:vanillate O-demethylase ferredoxin subunit